MSSVVRDLDTGQVVSGDQVVRCRTYGHAWDEFTEGSLGPPMLDWRLSLRCIRCSTQRHDEINLLGEVGSRRYLYPEGYRSAVGEPRMTREDYRQALYERFRARRRRSA
jgi:hypothetical protein